MRERLGVEFEDKPPIHFCFQIQKRAGDIRRLGDECPGGKEHHERSQEADTGETEGAAYVRFVLHFDVSFPSSTLLPGKDTNKLTAGWRWLSQVVNTRCRLRIKRVARRSSVRGLPIDPPS